MHGRCPPAVGGWTIMWCDCFRIFPMTFTGGNLHGAGEGIWCHIVLFDSYRLGEKWSKLNAWSAISPLSLRSTVCLIHLLKQAHAHLFFTFKKLTVKTIARLHQKLGCTCWWQKRRESIGALHNWLFHGSNWATQKSCRSHFSKIMLLGSEKGAFLLVALRTLSSIPSALNMLHLFFSPEWSIGPEFSAFKIWQCCSQINLALMLCDASLKQWMGDT